MAGIHISKNEKRAKHKKIALKIGGVVVAMQVISILLVMIICIFMYNSLITKMQKVRCTNGTNMLSYLLNQASGDGEMNQLLDGLKSRMGCEFTIFEGDTRAYTTVTQNGQRVVGTKLSSDLNTIVLQQGKSYVGETKIQGESYLCSYVPTKGDDGKINGLIFAGISRTEAKQEVVVVVAIAVIVSVITIVLGTIFLTAYLKKRVSAPLGEITRIAGQLEKGELGLADNEEIRVNVSSNDEVGMLGEMFEDTIHRLRSYIGEISNVLGSMANGDLTQSARQDYMGDFQSIKRSLDGIQAAFNNAMGQITSSAGQVSSGADQVSSSAQALAQGATEQASSIEEISATMMDISKNAKQTSMAAEEAGEYVNQAGSHLGVSIEFVKELNEAMENISGSSKKIGTIIATIEDIAFQINILALNAAVEAARAGTAGKGFAVVADEVSNLASKSDEAAKATKKLIESSIAAVTEGGHIVNKVTEALDQTSQSAGHVTAQMAIVVEAVEKQTAALSQVTDGIDQISSVVQTNSATSEQCAAASEELSSQANLLKDLMRSFKLRDIR
ncbi:MAG: methyl-accepting chemotaxis protein [Lachnospiraceae bacterium]|nr:methyl-accepting chemotaxis protein [Lachnospiraceae bacterium]MCI9283528.1 methyl-accepting chemotaxis protein [Lachnospiraceae bacterium]